MFRISRRKSCWILKQVEELKIKIQFLDNELELLENLIDFYENDNRLKPLSSDIFINIIKRMYLEHEVNGTEISINLGKLIYLNYTFVKRGVTEVENAELIEKLGEYFNKDGSFKYNENVEEFYSLLNLLENKSKRKFPYLNFCDILSDIIIQSLKCSNNNFRNNSEDDVTYDKQISLEAYKYIRNYYQNGKIILLPSDLEYFSEMLDKAGYSENDKAYILNLIEKTSLKYKQTSFIIHNSESRTRKKLFNVNNKGLLNSLAIHKHF